MTADIEIDSLEEGYVVTTRGAFSTKREYAPTLGQAFAKIIYRLLRQEGDVPYPHNKIEGENSYYESDTLKTITMLFKSTGPLAVRDALNHNFKDAEKFETDTEKIITEEGSQDI